MDTTKKMEKLFLSLKNNLPYDLDYTEFDNYFKLKDKYGRRYRLIPLSKKENAIFNSLYKSKCIITPVYTFSFNSSYYVLFIETINKSEFVPTINKLCNLCIELFDEYKYTIQIKRDSAEPLMSLYKVLDNKFSYFEMRIREIETKPIKYDTDWIILTKYHIILDAKIYLYDLQQDLFKFIDKKEEVEYGLIYKEINPLSINDNKLYPSFNIYYAPIGMLYSRLYLEYNSEIDFKKRIDKLSDFNKKYFLFMTIYICILNINLEVTITNKNVSNYLLVTKEISKIISIFKDYIK